MKALKIIGGIILGAVILLFIGSFFISNNFRAVQTQTLKASPEQAYNQLLDIKSWKHWSYWSLMDTTMQISYNGPETGVGAAYSWKSDNKQLGSGTMTIVGVEPNQYVLVTLDFNGQGKGLGEYIIKPAEGGGSEVTSAFNSETNSFIEKWMSRIMGKPMMKKSFKESMENMDKYIADHPAPIPDPAPIDNVAVEPL